MTANKTNKPCNLKASELNQNQKTLDIKNINEDGSFSCPTCKTFISPDDETEQLYTILDTKIKNDQITQIIIVCYTCNTKIILNNPTPI